MALILRDLFIGIIRFDQLHSDLGVSRKVLTERLNLLVDDVIVIKRAYSDRPAHYDYLLTDKGWELCDVLVAITAWGDRWTAGPGGPPATLHHRGWGRAVSAQIRCSHCGQPFYAYDTDVAPRGFALKRRSPSPTAALR